MDVKSFITYGPGVSIFNIWISIAMLAKSRELSEESRFNKNPINSTNLQALSLFQIHLGCSLEIKKA
jgi:hypothetical protein